MSARVCVVGSFMMDLVASAPRRPRAGETVIGTEFTSFVGGKGFNQAVAAARGGAHTAMVGRLGEDDFGESFRKALRVEGVDDSSVINDASAGTGVGLPVLEPDGQNSIIVVPRANWAIEPSHIRSSASAIEAADVLLLQLELPLPAVAEAARIARQAGTLVVLNPAPFAPIEEMRGLVDVFVPNEVELVALANADAPEGLEVVARRAAHHWKCAVVATLGSEGALVMSATGAGERIAPHRVAAIDTIGAGDTFCGYLAESLASGSSLVDAARTANAAAAIAVTRRAAAESAPRKVEVEKFVRNAELKTPNVTLTESSDLNEEATSW